VRTSGRSRATHSISLRIAQNVSCIAGVPPPSPAAVETRSNSIAPSSAPSSSAPTFAAAVSRGWSASTPARCHTASATGQNVMPSPYGRQRPTAAIASCASPPANSAARRDLPMPASPTTATILHSRRAAACLYASFSVRSSASRPTRRGVPARC
jgi:hypothetical protein